jgi:glycosyltransferase involved in cell wall biosynthesis
MVSFSLSALLPGSLSGLPRPDVVIGSSVHPLAAWAGLRLARRFGAKFVFEVRDLWPLTLIEMGRLERRNLSAKFLLYLERHLVRNAAHVISPLPLASDYMRRYRQFGREVSWVPNAVDLDDYPDGASSGPQDGLNLYYLGAHGRANSLETLIDAVHLLNERGEVPGLRLNLFGNGNCRRDLERRAQLLRLDNVRFHDSVNRADLQRICGDAAAFVTCARALPGLYRYGLCMNKLFDYMAMGRPILMAADAPVNPVEEERCGIVVPPEDPAALAAAIRRFAALRPYIREQMGRNGRRAVERSYNYARIAAGLSRILDGIAVPA